MVILLRRLGQSARVNTSTSGRLVELRSIATQIQCDIFHSSQDAVRLTEECGGCTDELWAFAKCGLKAAAEQQCGVQDCDFMFPIVYCNEGECNNSATRPTAPPRRA